MADDKAPTIKSEADYQALIPPVCQFQTTQEHWAHLGLCRSVTSGRVNKENHEGCKNCEFCTV